METVFVIGSIAFSLHHQDTMARNVQKTGNFEPYTLKIDFTNREKEHVSFSLNL